MATPRGSGPADDPAGRYLPAGGVLAPAMKRQGRWPNATTALCRRSKPNLPQVNRARKGANSSATIIPPTRNAMYTQLGLYIDGAWVNGNGKGEDVLNPVNEKPLARLPHAS